MQARSGWARRSRSTPARSGLSANRRPSLLLQSADGVDPVTKLLSAAAKQDLTSAYDRAAVLDWRIEEANEVTIEGPLPSLPGIPNRIAADPNWGPYLDARSDLVARLADQVRISPRGDAPAWAAQLHASMPAELIADVQVWRAAAQVDPSDLRPTGPPQLGHATKAWQRQLDKRLAAADTHTDRQWRQLLATEVPGATADPFLPELEEAKQPHPGRIRRKPPRAVGGRRRTATRRSPRCSPLVAHPRSAPANAEPGRRNSRGSPSNEAHDHAVTRPSATHAALGAASTFGPSR